MLTYKETEDQAVEAAKKAVADNYPAARATLSRQGLFGKELDRKARKLAFKMGGFSLPEGWSIARVTPDVWPMTSGRQSLVKG